MKSRRGVTGKERALETRDAAGSRLSGFNDARRKEKRLICIQMRVVLFFSWLTVDF